MSLNPGLPCLRGKQDFHIANRGSLVKCGCEVASLNSAGLQGWGTWMGSGVEMRKALAIVACVLCVLITAKMTRELDGLWSQGDSNMTRRACQIHSVMAYIRDYNGLVTRVGRHIPCHLVLNPCTPLSYFVDLKTTFLSERAILLAGTTRLRVTGVCWQLCWCPLIHDGSKGFKDGICGSSQSGNSLSIIPFGDVDMHITLPTHLLNWCSVHSEILPPSFPHLRSCLVKVTFSPLAVIPSIHLKGPCCLLDNPYHSFSGILPSPFPPTSLFFSNLQFLALTTTSDQWQRRQWHPTPVLLPGKSHGQTSLEGCSPWDRKESDTTEWLHFHFSLSCIGEGNGNPLQCSCLENPMDRGAWWAASLTVGHDWSDLAAAAVTSDLTISSPAPRNTTGPRDRCYYRSHTKH